MDGDPRRLSGGWILLVVLVVLGCLPALLAGWAVDFVACENEGSAACARQDLAHVQLWLAVAGLGLVVWIVVSAIRRRFTRTHILVVCALLLYAVWALLNDAAVHGWGSDMRLIP